MRNQIRRKNDRGKFSKMAGKEMKRLHQLNELEEDAVIWSRELMSAGSASLPAPPKKKDKGSKRLHELNELELIDTSL
jgi:hypothetical protein